MRFTFGAETERGCIRQRRIKNQVRTATKANVKHPALPESFARASPTSNKKKHIRDIRIISG